MGKSAGLLYHFSRVVVLPVSVVRSIVISVVWQSHYRADVKEELEFSVELCIKIFFCTSGRSCYIVSLFVYQVLEIVLCISERHILERCQDYDSMLDNRFGSWNRLIAPEHPCQYRSILTKCFLTLSSGCSLFCNSGVWNVSAMSQNSCRRFMTYGMSGAYKSSIPFIVGIIPPSVFLLDDRISFRCGVDSEEFISFEDAGECCSVRLDIHYPSGLCRTA